MTPLASLRAALFGCIVLLTNAALAQEKPNQETVATIMKLQKAVSASYDAGLYKEALSGLEAIYKLDPDPIYFYNMGLCQQNLDQERKALKSYHAFLEQVPYANPNYPKAQERATALEAELIPKYYYLGSLASATIGSITGVRALQGASGLRSRDPSSLDAAQTDALARQLRLNSFASDLTFAAALLVAGRGHQLSKRYKSAGNTNASLLLTPTGLALSGSY